MKYLALLLLTAAAFAQSHKLKSFQPQPVPSTSVFYDTTKALVISREGVYVCPDGWNLYGAVTVPRDKNGKKEVIAPDFGQFYLLPDKNRVFSTETQEIIALCIQITGK